ncbi:SRPBCC family protein [Solwaraspora sp. WMMD1047]|uniref:SRPBCC family protein n=1 Tax=Solwaraspora sp. WMMD1047 TaxID=3016102 RepID=UPI00241674DF|nr:SRPBCC family protein [Solwaraspora sp. WMMD1047]MDG4833546.1 SRPBCC family protein [Solwaraspora sp. WMMD1047]
MSDPGSGWTGEPGAGRSDATAEGRGGERLRAAAQPGAGEVTATVIVNAAADRVFAGFTAWERQGEWIPFTRVRVVQGDGGEGSLVEAVTAVGPAVLRDEMRVVRLDPPYEVRVVHCGSVLRGPGVLRCTQMDRERTQVVWHEWFHLPGGAAGRVAWPVLWPGSKFSLTQALKRFARLVERGRLP